MQNDEQIQTSVPVKNAAAWPHPSTLQFFSTGNH